MKKHLALIFALCLILMGCGKSNSADPSESADNVITLGMIDANGTSQVTIPLGVLGGSVDGLSGYTVSVAVNDETVASDLDPRDYYIDFVDVVAFYMEGVSDADTVTFTVTVLETGDSVDYVGLFSEEEESEAIIIVPEETQ